jgi:hypothetical protein
MIYINKNATNIIDVTLTEASKLAAPFFLFEFTPEFERVENPTSIYFTGPDLSAYPQRINLFELVEGENGNEDEANGFEELEEGGAHLKLKRGQYSYKVYESETETLDPQETTGRILEQGRLVVETEIDEEDEGQNNNPEANVYE